MPNVTLRTYNTVPLAAASGAYVLSAGTGWTGMADVLNLGPGTIYIRADANPAVNDPASLALPANTAANGLTLVAAGLRVIAAADTTISLKMY